MEIANKIVKTDLIEWKNLEWLQGKLKAIPESSLKKLKQSLINNSFVQPFNVWENGKLWILDGHHRKLAMEQLALEGYDIPDKLPANFIQCKDKKEASKMVLLYSSIYAKADEKSLDAFLTENEIDFSEVSGEIDLPELNLDTFGVDDIDDEKLDAVPEPQKDPISKLGDIFLIDGKHRVMCGDNSLNDNWEVLFQDKKANLIFTDPPYNKGYGYNSYLDLRDDYWEWIDSLFKILDKYLYDNASIYIKQHTLNIANQIINSPFTFSHLIIWPRMSQAHPKDNYDNATEPIIFFKKGNPMFNVWAEKRESIDKFINADFRDKDFKGKMWNIWSDIKPITGGFIRQKESTSSGGSKQHPAQMPVALVTRALNFSSNESNICCDPFLGSGTSLTASQQTNRICYGMEIDPIYIDVILRRYKNLYPEAKFECLNREFDFETLFSKN